MRDTQRHQKTVEKKRRKREERRREHDARLRARLAAPADEGHVFLSKVDGFDARAATWPVVAAYAPSRDVWRATGLGLAGVVRRQPDGRFSSAFFMLDLSDSGLKGAFGKVVDALEDVDLLLEELHDLAPRPERGPVELAADYAWGARALADSTGAEFPPEVERFFALMPRPAGGSRRWLERLLGPGGLTPPDLVRVVQENPRPDDIDESQELMTLTEATFRLEDPHRVRAALRHARPDFQLDHQDGDEEVFTWSRKYPGGHWSPLALLGGRQTLGSVRVGPEWLVAQANALSMAAKLIDTLARLTGDALRLESTRWTTQQDLLRRAIDRGGG